MDDVDTLKTQIRKLNAWATSLMMNLHDLAEELPTGWERIPGLAEDTFQAYRRLAEARARLASGGD